MSADENPQSFNPEDETISEHLSEITSDDELTEEEIEIHINPDEQKLQELGVTLTDFEDAFEKALEADEELFEKTEDVENIRPLGEIPITLAGQTFRLDEIAEITSADDTDIFK